MQPSALLTEVLEQVARQPHTKSEADQAFAYYDGHQTNEEIALYRYEHEMPDLTVNLVKDAINSVLGHEEKSRTDLMTQADDDESEEIAEAINAELHEVLRMVDCNHHLSEGFKPMCIGGRGWARFGRSRNPLEYRYEMETIHRDEMICDERSRRHDKQDCRWMARRKFMDQDAAIALLPEHKSLIENTFSNWQSWDIAPMHFMGQDVSRESYQYILEANTQRYQASLWMNDGTRKVAVYQVAYREHKPVPLCFYEDGRVEEFDLDNPGQWADVFASRATVRNEHLPTMREAWYIGPTLVEDAPSSEPHNYFPWVPLEGYKDDETNIPYGLVRDMIGPQDAYNSSNVKIHHILNSKRIFATLNAFGVKDGMTDEQVIHEINRKDGLIYVKSLDDIRVEQDIAELNKLFDIKAHAREEIRAAAGINFTFTGQQEQQSGVAQQTAAELTLTGLSEFLSSYRFAKMMIGRIALAHLHKDIGNRPHQTHIKQGFGQQRKTVVLNEADENGVTNNLSKARIHIALAEIETSHGYREQENQRLSRMYETSAPELQNELLPLIIETSTFRNKDQVVANLNKSRGRGMSEEEQQQLDMQAAEQAKEAADLQRRLAEAEISKAEAEAARLNAEADKAKAEKEKIELEKAQIARAVQGMPVGDAANDDSEQKLEMLKKMRGAIGKPAMSL